MSNYELSSSSPLPSSRNEREREGRRVERRRGEEEDWNDKLLDSVQIPPCQTSLLKQSNLQVHSSLQDHHEECPLLVYSTKLVQQPPSSSSTHHRYGALSPLSVVNEEEDLNSTLISPSPSPSQEREDKFEDENEWNSCKSTPLQVLPHTNDTPLSPPLPPLSPPLSPLPLHQRISSSPLIAPPAIRKVKVIPNKGNTPPLYDTHHEQNEGSSSNSSCGHYEELPPPSALMARLFPSLKKEKLMAKNRFVQSTSSKPHLPAITTPISTTPSNTVVPPTINPPSVIPPTYALSTINSPSVAPPTPTPTTVTYSKEIQDKLIELENEINTYKMENVALQKLRTEKEQVLQCTNYMYTSCM